MDSKLSGDPSPRGFCQWLASTDLFLLLSVAGTAGMLGGAVNGTVEILLYYFGVNTLLSCTLVPIPYVPAWMCTSPVRE